MKTPRCILALAAAAVVAAVPQPAPAQSSRATEAGTELEIRAVRVVYQQVMREIAANRLVRRDSTVHCGNDDPGLEATYRTDAAGHIRQLEWSGGSDDHAETHRFYYDAAGRLRFIFVTRGAVNGTQEEERVYYAAGGRILRRAKSQVHGPGYFFTPATPIWHPAAWLGRPCPDGE